MRVRVGRVTPGLIDTVMSPYSIVHEAIEDARHICFRQYGDAPEIALFGSEDLQVRGSISFVSSPWGLAPGG